MPFHVSALAAAGPDQPLRPATIERRDPGNDAHAMATLPEYVRHHNGHRPSGTGIDELNRSRGNRGDCRSRRAGMRQIVRVGHRLATAEVRPRIAQVPRKR